MKELVKNGKRKKSIDEEELNVAHFENAYLTVAKVESFRFKFGLFISRDLNKLV